MKLARKLTFAIILGVLFVLAAHAYSRLRREIGYFEADMQRDARVMGRILGNAVAEVWQSEGPEKAQSLVRSVNERESELLVWWIGSDGISGDPSMPSLAPEDVKLLAQNQPFSRKGFPSNDGLRLTTYVPVRIDAARSGALAFAESLASETHYIRRTVVNTAIVTVVMALICGVIATFVGVWLVGRPVQSLIEQARRIGQGDLSQRLTLRQRDEIGELSREMNTMCDHLTEANEKLAIATTARIAAIEQLRHADRLATVGKLASGLAHELGAPLQVISGHARMFVDDEVPPEEMKGDARTILEQAQRMAHIIRQLLDFARRRGAEKEATDLRALVRTTCGMLEPIARKRRASLENSLGDAPLSAQVDHEQIRQALTNLLLNGVQAVEPGGHVRTSLAVERARPPADHGGPEAAYARIAVEDDGAGIAPEVKEHIFEPFFTTKQISEGTGLGLSVAYGIVREHGGWIDVSSELGAGSRFCIYLPLDTE